MLRAKKVGRYKNEDLRELRTESKNVELICFDERRWFSLSSQLEELLYRYLGIDFKKEANYSASAAGCVSPPEDSWKELLNNLLSHELSINLLKSLIKALLGDWHLGVLKARIESKNLGKDTENINKNVIHKSQMVMKLSGN